MLGMEEQIERLMPFTLVLFRMSGLFLAVPMLSSISIPFQAKVLASLIMSAAVFPTLEATLPVMPQSITLWSVVPLVAAELTVGLVLGLLAAVPIMAMQAGGYIMGFQMGLSLASVYNPELDTQSDLLGEMFFIIGIGIFAMLGGLDVLLISLLASFDRVPLGSLGVLGSGPPLEVYLGLLASGFELALRISAPVTATAFLLLLAMGFVMKTMPQINILTVGFAIKILVGVLAVIVSILIIADTGYNEIHEGLDAILGWVESLGSSSAVSTGEEAGG